MKTNFVYNQSTDCSSPVDTCCLVGRLAGLAALSLRMSRAGKRCSSLQPPPITHFSTTDRFSSDSLQHGPSNFFSPKKNSTQSIICRGRGSGAPPSTPLLPLHPPPSSATPTGSHRTACNTAHPTDIHQRVWGQSINHLNFSPNQVKPSVAESERTFFQQGSKFEGGSRSGSTQKKLKNVKYSFYMSNFKRNCPCETFTTGAGKYENRQASQHW